MDAFFVFSDSQDVFPIRIWFVFYSYVFSSRDHSVCFFSKIYLPAGSSVPGSGTFPFDTVVVLRRQLDTWHVYAKSGATSRLEFVQPKLQR